MAPAPQFVVTPWRDANELLALRRDLFAVELDAIDVRETAVNKVVAWRARKLELPLLLESTADVVEARLRDEQGCLPTNALKWVYATAISRFVTGLLDTQTDLTRLSLPSQTAPTIPVTLRETRHRIVHRHLPSLAELKHAAQECLGWLWEHYWSHLDTLLAPNLEAPHLSSREVRDRLQGVLKAYVKERKAEIKSKSRKARAADNALGSYIVLHASRDGKLRALLELLVQEKQILPVGKKLGTSMQGAYLIWTPFLVSVSKAEPLFLRALTERMVDVLGATARVTMVEEDPAKEGMHDWLVHILTSTEWSDAGQRSKNLTDDVLGVCFTAPTFWTLKLAEHLLTLSDLPGKKLWQAIWQAARTEKQNPEAEQPLPSRPANASDEMEVEPVDVAMPVSEPTEEKKIRGPQKYPGFWRPQPIGWIPPDGT